MRQILKEFHGINTIYYMQIEVLLLNDVITMVMSFLLMFNDVSSVSHA